MKQIEFCTHEVQFLPVYAYRNEISCTIDFVVRRDSKIDILMVYILKMVLHRLKNSSKKYIEPYDMFG